MTLSPTHNHNWLHLGGWGLEGFPPAPKIQHPYSDTKKISANTAKEHKEMVLSLHPAKTLFM